MMRRGGAGVSPFSSARRQKSVRVRTEKVNFLVGSRAAIGQLLAGRGARGLLGTASVCVCCTARPRREAAPAACAGSLRLRAPSNVPSRRASSTLAAGHGFGKEAHETVSWEKGRAAPGRFKS